MKRFWASDGRMKRKTDICRPYKGSNIKEDETGPRIAPEGMDVSEGEV